MRNGSARFALQSVVRLFAGTLASIFVVAGIAVETATAQSAPVFVTEANIDGTRTYHVTGNINASGTGIFVMVPDVTIDLHGYTLTFGTDNRHGAAGVYPFIRRSNREGGPGGVDDGQYLGSDDYNYSETVTPQNGKRTKVKNGRITWGGTTGTWATGVAAPWDSGELILDNVRIDVGGQDGMCVNFRYSPSTITNTYCKDLSTTTENRHQLPAGLKVGGKLIAHHNVVEGGNSGIVCGSLSVIYDNVIRQTGFATNGYAVSTYRNTGTQTYNNLIVPTNGRGILYNAGDNHVAYDNLILALEKPNAEYGSDLNATCARLRYDTKNIAFTNNKCLAIGGTTLTSGSGIYLSNYDGTPNTISNNEFRSILTQDPTVNKYANAITMESQGTPTVFSRDKIEDNAFRSNNYLIRLSGYDGGSWQDIIERNSLGWVSGSETVTWFNAAIDDTRYNYTYPGTNTYVTSALLATTKSTVKSEVAALISAQSNNRQRKTFYAGYYGASFITLIDTVLNSGVTMDVGDVFLYSSTQGETNIKIGHSLYIDARDSAGSTPLANQTVTVSDDSGTTFTGQTDANGKAKLLLVDYMLQKPNVTTFTVTRFNRTSHTATISGYQPQSLPLTPTNNPTSPLVLTFVSTSLPTCGGQPATIVSADPTVNGTAAADVIVGTSTGAQNINGLGGNDKICAGNGGSTIYGGDGDDSIYGGSGVDTVYGENGNDTIVGNGGNDTLRGGNGNDTIDGGAGNDYLVGDWGLDVIYGGLDNDSIYGGGDNDTLDGGANTDSCDGGTQTDTATACETLVNVP